MDKSGSVIDQLEALSAQLETLAPCPFSRSLFIGWLVKQLQILQGEGLSGAQVRAQLEHDYLAWIRSA